MLSATSRGRVPGATCRVEPSGSLSVIIGEESPESRRQSRPYNGRAPWRDKSNRHEVHGSQIDGGGPHEVRSDLHNATKRGVIATGPSIRKVAHMNFSKFLRSFKIGF